MKLFDVLKLISNYRYFNIRFCHNSTNSSLNLLKNPLYTICFLCKSLFQFDCFSPSMNQLQCWGLNKTYFGYISKIIFDINNLKVQNNEQNGSGYICRNDDNNFINHMYNHLYFKID